MTKETIYETYARTVCRNCKNRERCQEELIIKIDNTIKCDYYEQENKMPRKKKTPINWQSW